jgi:alpha-glucosidase
VVCDHPDNIRNQPGSDFLKIVPTVWDDTRFLGGHPDDFVALARRNGATWYLGVMNNSQRKTVEIKLDFLPPGTYDMEIWADTKKSDTEPTTLQKKVQTVSNGEVVKVELAVNGGCVATITRR